MQTTLSSFRVAGLYRGPPSIGHRTTGTSCLIYTCLRAGTLAFGGQEFVRPQGKSKTALETGEKVRGSAPLCLCIPLGDHRGLLSPSNALEDRPTQKTFPKWLNITSHNWNLVWCVPPWLSWQVVLGAALAYRRNRNRNLNREPLEPDSKFACLACLLCVCVCVCVFVCVCVCVLTWLSCWLALWAALAYK